MIIKQEIVGKSSKVRYQKNKLRLDVSHQANFNPNIDARLKSIWEGKTFNKIILFSFYCF